MSAPAATIPLKGSPNSNVFRAPCSRVVLLEQLLPASHREEGRRLLSSRRSSRLGAAGECRSESVRGLVQHRSRAFSPAGSPIPYLSFPATGFPGSADLDLRTLGFRHSCRAMPSRSFMIREDALEAPYRSILSLAPGRRSETQAPDNQNDNPIRELVSAMGEPHGLHLK